MQEYGMVKKSHTVYMVKKGVYIHIRVYTCKNEFDFLRYAIRDSSTGISQQYVPRSWVSNAVFFQIGLMSLFIFELIRKK